MCYFKNLFGEACSQSPLGSSRPSALTRRLRPPKKYRVRCFQNYVRYFKNLSKTPQYDFFLLVVRGIILSVTLRRAHEACDMGEPGERQNKTVHTSIRFCLKMHFFPPISPTVHLYSVKTIIELRIFAKTLSRVKIFENAGHSFTCGRTTEVFEYDDVMHHLLLA